MTPAGNRDLRPHRPVRSRGDLDPHDRDRATAAVARTAAVILLIAIRRYVRMQS